MFRFWSKQEMTLGQVIVRIYINDGGYYADLENFGMKGGNGLQSLITNFYNYLIRKGMQP